MKDCATVAVTATVSSAIIFVVIEPVSPNEPAIVIIELVADEGLVICAVPEA